MSRATPSLQIAERKALLLLVDALVVLLSTVVALWQWSQWDASRTISASDYLAWSVVVPIWLTAMALNQCYELRVASVPVRVVKALLLTAALLFGLYLLVYFGAPRESLPRAVILLQGSIALGGLGAWRLSYAALFHRSRFRRRVLILSGGRAGAAIAATLAAHGAPTFEIAGVLEEGSFAGEAGVEDPMSDERPDLLDAVSRYRASEIVVAIDRALSPELLEGLLVVQERGIQITPMPLMHEALTGQVPVEHLGDNWWGTLPLAHPQTRALYSLAKRLLDLIIAIPSLLVFTILLPFLATGIKLDSRGHVFYRQRRVGKHGRTFTMMKLRTMIVDAEPEGRPVWAAQRDPRITRVGRILRATMLDEIPQLWNVLKGEMSIVGPRPERPELVAELETKIPYYRLRHAAAPGMAGWSLLHEGYSGTAEKALTKLQYDLYYIKHQSLWLDLQIILRTLGHGLTFRRSERKSEESDPVLH